MSDIHRLSFGIVSKLSDKCAELIVNEGVEVNLDMVFEYHDWLLKNLETPMYILLHKMFPCSYSFEAQTQLASLKEVDAMAVVAYDKVSQATTQIMKSVPHEGNWTIEIFEDREVALSWLTRLSEEHKTKLNLYQIA